jgi:hypothetical protein
LDDLSQRPKGILTFDAAGGALGFQLTSYQERVFLLGF